MRCLGFWFSIGVCGIYLVFLLQAALGGVLFTTTFTGNNIGVFAVSRLACYFFNFFLDLFAFLRGGFFFPFFTSRWGLIVYIGKRWREGIQWALSSCSRVLYSNHHLPPPLFFRVTIGSGARRSWDDPRRVSMQEKFKMFLETSGNLVCRESRSFFFFFLLCWILSD